MSVNVIQYKLKAKRLLEKFLVGENYVQSETLLNKLLSHLEWENKTDCETILPIAFEWILRTVPTWSTSAAKPPIDIISFTLNLASLLSQDEARFKKLNCNNFFIKLVNLAKVGLSDCLPLKFAYIKLLFSFLNHSSGIEWMIVCNFWEDIVNWSLTTSENDLSKESTRLLKTLLEKTFDFDGDFCDRVIKKIIRPLGENIYRCIKFTEDVSDEMAVSSILPTVKLLGNLLESSLRDVLLEKKGLGVAFLFLNNFHLEGGIFDFMAIAQKQCVLYDLTKIMFMMQFLELYGQVITNTITVAEITKFVDRIGNNFLAKLFRGDFSEQMDFCSFTLFFWKLMKSKIAYCQENFVADQLMFFMIMPHFCFHLKYIFTIPEIETRCDCDHYRDRMVQKMFKIFTNDFVRVASFWRNQLIDNSDLIKASISSFNALKSAHKFLSQDQAVQILQVFTYILLDVVDASKNKPEKLDIFVKESWYTLKFLDEIITIIEHFDITLKDAMEVTYLMDICFELSLRQWPSEVRVKILKLIDIAGARYLASTLTLLVGDTKETTLSLLGSVLHFNLRNERSEVIKAALDVLHTVVRISNNQNTEKED